MKRPTALHIAGLLFIYVLPPGVLAQSGSELPPVLNWRFMQGAFLDSFAYDRDEESFYVERRIDTDLAVLKITSIGTIAARSFSIENVSAGIVRPGEIFGYTDPSAPGKFNLLPLAPNTYFSVRLDAALNPQVPVVLPASIRGIVPAGKSNFYDPSTGRMFGADGGTLWTNRLIPDFSYSGTGSSSIAAPDDTLLVAIKNLAAEYQPYFGRVPKGNVVFKMAMSGELLWYGEFISPDSTLGPIACDKSGNSYFSGYLNSTNVTWAGERLLPSSVTSVKGELFVAKIDPNGRLLWTSTTTDGPQKALIIGITTDDLGSSYISGTLQGTLQTGTLHGSLRFGDIKIPAGQFETPFLVKLDPTGQPVWGVPVTLFQPLAGYQFGASGDGNSLLFMEAEGLTMYVGVPSVAPVLDFSPEVLVAPVGTRVSLHPLLAQGRASGYQWLVNGRPLPGENSAEISVKIGNDPSGVYTLLAWNAAGRSTNYIAYVGPAELPRLRIAREENKLLLAWNISAINCLVESASEISGVFQRVPADIRTNLATGEFQATLQFSGSQSFFQVRQGP